MHAFYFVEEIKINRENYNIELCFPLSVSNKDRYFEVPVIASQCSSIDILHIWRYARGFNDIKNTSKDITLLRHVNMTVVLIGQRASQWWCNCLPLFGRTANCPEPSKQRNIILLWQKAKNNHFFSFSKFTSWKLFI